VSEVQTEGWTLLAASSGEDGSLTAFKVAIDPDQLLPAGNGNATWAWFTLLPLLDGASPLEWGAILFLREADGLTLTAIQASGPLLVAAGPGEPVREVPAAFEPRFLITSMAFINDAWAKQAIDIQWAGTTPSTTEAILVVGARGPPGPFTLGIKPLHEAPEGYFAANPGSVDDLKKEVEEGAAIAEPIGFASGYSMTHYLWSMKPGAQEFSFTPGIEVEAKRNPIGADADLFNSSLTYEGPFKEGFGIGAGNFFSWDAKGQWSVKGEAHGVRFDARNAIVLDGIPLGFVEHQIFGWPGFYYQAEGSGGVAYTFDLEGLNRQSGGAAIGVWNLHFGTRLQELAGQPLVRNTAGVWTGALGSIPPQ
jgi:hypothetical protein